MNDRILWSIDHKLVTFMGIMRKVCGSIYGMILFGFGRSALRSFIQNHVLGICWDLVLKSRFGKFCLDYVTVTVRVLDLDAVTKDKLYFYNRNQKGGIAVKQETEYIRQRRVGRRHQG